MRAILCASIFFAWREGEYIRQHQPGYDTAATLMLRPGTDCRLAHTRASMGRLIAGLNVQMFRQDLSDEQGTDYVVTYEQAAIPLGSFPTAALPVEQGPPGTGRAGGSPATTAAQDIPASAPAADGGGGGDGSPGPRRSCRSRRPL
jgi:hypothetical protein